MAIPANSSVKQQMAPADDNKPQNSSVRSKMVSQPQQAAVPPRREPGAGYSLFGPRADRSEYSPGFTSFFEEKEHVRPQPVHSDFGSISARTAHMTSPFWHINPGAVDEAVQGYQERRAARHGGNEEGQEFLQIEQKKTPEVSEGLRQIGAGRERIPITQGRRQIGSGVSKEVAHRAEPNWEQGNFTVPAPEFDSGPPQLAAAPHGATSSPYTPRGPVPMRRDGYSMQVTPGGEVSRVEHWRMPNAGDFGVRGDVSHRFGEFIGGGEKARTPSRGDSPLNRETPPEPKTPKKRAPRKPSARKAK